MKRFSETDKWKDPWFRKLSAVEKLVFLYLIDNCNNAGFCELDPEIMATHIGCSEADFEGALKGLSRGIVGAGGWVWVKNFLKHQKNLVLNPENPAHRQIIGFLKEQEVRFAGCPEVCAILAPFKAPPKGLPSPTGTGQGKGAGQGKGKGRGSAEGETIEIPDDLMLIKGFEKEWADFREHRKQLGKPMTANAQKLTLAKLATRPEDAVEMIRQAIENGWQGMEFSWLDQRRAQSGRNGHSVPLDKSRTIGLRPDEMPPVYDIETDTFTQGA